MKDSMIGVDLAKRVFQMRGASKRGDVKFRRKLTRDQLRAFMAQQAPAMVVFEVRPRALARLLTTARDRLTRAEALIVATAEHVAPEIAHAALRFDDAYERPVTADQP